MRRSRALVTLSPILATFALLACETDNSVGTPSFSLDAGQSDFVFPEASTPDAPDADSGLLEDAGPKGISITVLGESAPVEGVRVLFHDEQGGVVGEQQTDATGRVTTSSAPHMVTAMAVGEDLEESSPWLLTYVGVEDGDALVIRVPPKFSDESDARNLSVQLPSTNYAEAAGYYASANGDICSAYTGLGEPTPSPISIYLYPECIVDPGVVLAEAYTEGSDSPPAFLFAKGVAIPGADQTQPVSLADEWKVATTSTVTIDNAPPDYYFETSLFQIVKTGVHTVGFRAYAPYEESDVTFNFFVAPDFADAHQISSIVYHDNDLSSAIVDKRVAPASTHTLDLATALGFITEVSVDAETTGRPEITWTTSSDLTNADGAALRLLYLPGGDEIPLDYVSWSIVFPASLSKVVFPALPNDAQDFAPQGSIHIDSMLAVESSLINGYADVRRLPLSSEFPLHSRDRFLPLNGTARYTIYGSTGYQPTPR